MRASRRPSVPTAVTDFSVISSSTPPSANRLLSVSVANTVRRTIVRKSRVESTWYLSSSNEATGGNSSGLLPGKRNLLRVPLTWIPDSSVSKVKVSSVLSRRMAIVRLTGSNAVPSVSISTPSATSRRIPTSMSVAVKTSLPPEAVALTFCRISFGLRVDAMLAAREKAAVRGSREQVIFIDEQRLRQQRFAEYCSMFYNKSPRTVACFGQLERRHGGWSLSLEIYLLFFVVIGEHHDVRKSTYGVARRVLERA